MKNHFVLIDYENIACSNIKLNDELHVLKELYENQHQQQNNIKFFIFTTSSQLSISFDVVEELFKFDHEYFKVQKVGSNTLNVADFCIARQLGVLETSYSRSVLYILSKDKGYDSLVRHCNKYEKNENLVFRIEYLSDLKSIIEILKDHRALEDTFKNAEVRNIVLQKFLQKSHTTQAQLNMSVSQQILQNTGIVLSSHERLSIFKYCVEKGLAQISTDNKLIYEPMIKKEIKTTRKKTASKKPKKITTKRKIHTVDTQQQKIQTQTSNRRNSMMSEQSSISEKQTNTQLIQNEKDEVLTVLDALYEDNNKLQ